MGRLAAFHWLTSGTERRNSGLTVLTSDGEAYVPASGVTPCLGASFSAEEDRDIGSDTAEMFFLIDIKADAQADQQND